MTVRTATCACGQLRVMCSGDPMLVSLCHCDQCQKRTGSAFGVAAFFRRDAVTTEGQAHRYTRIGDSGMTLTFHFCPVCGSSVFWEPQRRPDAIAVALGAFADPAFPAPTQDVYVDHRHRWLRLDL